MTDKSPNQNAVSAAHPAMLPDDALLAQCEVLRQRRSGPGGQHRNKVESGVVLVYRPTATRVEATERRSQHENKRVALRRLRLRLALTVRRPVPPEQQPSARWRQRVANRRLHVNVDHADFPWLLAEALDVVHGSDYDVVHAACQLGISTSQLVRFLKQEPRALQAMNSGRRDHDRPPLR